MRAHVEVIFDGDEERRTLRLLSRWHGAEREDPEDPVERGGRLARNIGDQRNHGYNHRQLSDILEWIVASTEHFDDRIALGQSMMDAEPEPQEGDGVPLIFNPAVAGSVIVESSEEAQRDLIAASYIITEALKIATPKAEKYQFA